MTRRSGWNWRRAGDAGLRLSAAVPLGYAVASLWAVALSRILPMDRADATITGTLFAIAFCAFAAMWAYASRSGWRAVWTLAVIGAAGWAVIQVSGR
ncbi:MAG: hypothetical protein K5799_04930 [Erythrobacter sp.]|nr:hypothetical protein [Erythrobacter sp.]